MAEHSRSTYLIDRSLQLKATALVVGLTLVVGVPLGWMVLREAREAVNIGQQAVEIGQAANATNAEAIKESELLNTRLEMEMMMKLGDPKKVEELKKANGIETEKLKARADAAKLAGEKLQQQRDSLEKSRRALVYGVGGGIAALVLLVALFGVILTHKIAGPLYRVRQLFREVGEGKFSPYRPLRKGDELQEFFGEFSTMVEQLKEQQRKEIAHLGEAIEKAAQAGVSDGSLYDLRAVRDAMAKAVEGRPSAMKSET
ncbi:MAG: hypothetical protein ACXVEF_33160 [Polyangiales bacterium]